MMRWRMGEGLLVCECETNRAVIMFPVYDLSTRRLFISLRESLTV
jgi:hypothetical protein